MVELLVTLAVAIVLVSIAVPAMNVFVAKRATSAGADELAHAMRIARSEALKRAATISVCASADPNASAPSCGSSTDWVNGWLVFLDADKDQTLGDDDLLISVGQPSSSVGGLTEDSDEPAAMFLANGLADGGRTFELTPRLDATNSGYDAAVRKVCVNVAGRVTVLQGESSTC
jgi:type IV fimbrial biogenesis protein FimT